MHVITLCEVVDQVSATCTGSKKIVDSILNNSRKQGSRKPYF